MDPARIYRTGSRAVRHSGVLAAMAGGWLAAECRPHVLAAQAISSLPVPVGPVGDLAHGVAAQHSDVVLDRVLREAFGDRFAEEAVHPRTPSRRAGSRGPVTVLRYRRRYCAGAADIAYFDGGRAHTLDIWRRPDTRRDAPVLLHIPGGAWSVNDKRGQGYPLLAAMAERGWVGVSVNYRRSPHHAWPAHVVDVKRAVAWVRRNIADFGGDPGFIAVTGGSAGGHLSALTALTVNEPRFQPGFESADTTVHAAVPMYGVFDLTDSRLMHPQMMPFLERSVLKTPLAHSRDIYELASPVCHVSSDAPPFFVLHGAKDNVVPPGQSRVFSAALRSAGAPTVLYAELPNAHHMFDALASVRAHLVAQNVAAFLGIVYARHLAARTGGPLQPGGAREGRGC
ncbi:alpha/beta hydrolase [Mycobacterium sp. ACS4331]|uniref:alpha/beta hydrolase n=1 Tax=Mycobacterium sp. ACS4331 TaxID=1834121 RepID=UPI0012F76ABB|nr:alpha/beta hydrolase [Mycobacterium sp. ACS4331]